MTLKKIVLTLTLPLPLTVVIKGSKHLMRVKPRVRVQVRVQVRVRNKDRYKVRVMELQMAERLSAYPSLSESPCQQARDGFYGQQTYAGGGLQGGVRARSR